MAGRAGIENNEPEEGDRSDPLFAEHRVLIIGIGKYSDRGIKLLPEPARDAERVRKTLEMIGYSPGKVRCLCDEEATFEAIRAELRKLGSMKQRASVLLVLWAGHGAANSHGKSFLLPYDTKLHGFEQTAFPIDELIWLVRSANAGHKAIFLDTCFAFPSNERLFLPAWHRLDLVNVPPSLAFAGASTYFAIEQPGSGGILTSCLREALNDRHAALCDPEGTVHLADVIAYLQRHLRPRALAAWKQAGETGLFPQDPYIAFAPGERVPAGRHVPTLFRSCIGNGHRMPEYIQRLVRRILISWSRDPLLKEYVPRLLHECLELDTCGPTIATLTSQYMAGRCSRDKYLERLRMELAVLDQLSSAPWPYGIRARRGADTQWLAPIIPPDVPILSGRELQRQLRTVCVGQRHARIEVFAGPDVGHRTEGAIPLLARRVRLPEGLPQGETIEVAIKRLGAAKMRVALRIPRLGGAAALWWWVEDSAGFSDLAADEARRFHESKGENGVERGLKLLLQGCIDFLNRSWRLLTEEAGNRLAKWVQQTSSALVKRNEAGIKNALRLLLDDLSAVRNESVAVALEALLAATEAPEEVTAAFEQLAAQLLSPPKKPEQIRIVREQMITVVAEWHERWRHDPAQGREPEKARQAEMLAHLLDALESPQVQEKAVASLMEKEPLASQLFASFGDTFRTSRWTSQMRRETRELVDYHLRIIDQLAFQVRQEDLYYAKLFQSLAEDSGIGDLSAEAQEPLGAWQALAIEDVRRVIDPPAWAREPAAEPAALPLDADELLEEIPEEIEA